jgi:hypothetical protein
MEQSKAIGQKVKQIHHSSCIQLAGRFQRNLDSDDHFDRPFSFTTMKANYENKNSSKSIRWPYRRIPGTLSDNNRAGSTA